MSYTLAVMGVENMAHYFVLNSSRLVSADEIKHYNLREKCEVVSRFWLPPGPTVVGITAGASCPNNLIEETLIRLFELRGIHASNSSSPPKIENPVGTVLRKNLNIFTKDSTEGSESQFYLQP